MDRTVNLTEIDEQYADPSKLTARQSLWQFLPGPALPDRVVDLVPPDAVVADVGCGNGVYLERLRRRGSNPDRGGFDLSPGMARAASAHAPTAVADAQALPLRAGSVDVVLCLHMLYHVPDIARALRELRRVLRPGGLALVTTNGAGHIAELKAVMDSAARWVAGTGVDPDWDSAVRHRHRQGDAGGGVRRCHRRAGRRGECRHGSSDDHRLSRELAAGCRWCRGRSDMDRGAPRGDAHRASPFRAGANLRRHKYRRHPHRTRAGGDGRAATS